MIVGNRDWGPEALDGLTSRRFRRFYQINSFFGASSSFSMAERRFALLSQAGVDHELS